MDQPFLSLPLDKTVMSCRKNGSVTPVKNTTVCAKQIVNVKYRFFCRQTLYRGEAHGQDRVHLRVSLHRVRHLRQKVRAIPQKFPSRPVRLRSELWYFRCPFEAIAIINLPTNLESAVTHRYTANSFKLHRLPTPRPGQVLGLVGTNGIGKSTALKILAGKLKPNLGRYDVRSLLTLVRIVDESTFDPHAMLAGPTRLARNPEILPRIGTAKLFHEGPRR